MVLTSVTLLQTGLGFETQTASSSYAGLAATLSGLVLAVLVLILQLPANVESVNLKSERRHPETGFITLALIVSLFGCIVSTLNYAMLSGIDGHSPAIPLVTMSIGIGFAISVLLIFLALYLLSLQYIRPESSMVIYWVCFIFGIGSLVFLNVNIYDFANYGKEDKDS
jgi:hypothetical protein